MTANAGRIPKQYVHKAAKTEKSIRTENYTKNDLIKPTTNSSFPTSLTKPRTLNTNNTLTISEKKKLETYDSSKIKLYNNYRVENITTVSNKNKNLFNINEKSTNNNNTRSVKKSDYGTSSSTKQSTNAKVASLLSTSVESKRKPTTSTSNKYNTTNPISVTPTKTPKKESSTPQSLTTQNQSHHPYVRSHSRSYSNLHDDYVSQSIPNTQSYSQIQPQKENNIRITSNINPITNHNIRHYEFIGSKLKNSTNSYSNSNSSSSYSTISESSYSNDLSSTTIPSRSSITSSNYSSNSNSNQHYAAYHTSSSLRSNHKLFLDQDDIPIRKSSLAYKLSQPIVDSSETLCSGRSSNNEKDTTTTSTSHKYPKEKLYNDMKSKFKTKSKLRSPLSYSEVKQTTSSLSKYSTKNNNNSIQPAASKLKKNSGSGSSSNLNSKKYNVNNSNNLINNNDSGGQMPTTSSISSRITAINSPHSHIYKNFTDNNGIPMKNNNMEKLDNSIERINCIYLKTNNNNNNNNNNINMNMNINMNKNVNSINEYYNHQQQKKSTTSSSNSPKNIASQEKIYNSQYQPVLKNTNALNCPPIQNNINIIQTEKNYSTKNNNETNKTVNKAKVSMLSTSLPVQKVIITPPISSTDSTKSAFDLDNIDNINDNHTVSSTNSETITKSPSKKSLKEKLKITKINKLKKKDEDSIPEAGYTIQELLKMDFPNGIDYESESILKNCSDIVGLINLGNTCFMNSMLQCIFSTIPLCTYFMSLKFKKDINPKSSMKGQFALAFNDLLCETLKNTKNKLIKPIKFKRELEKFAPQFCGYEQQDSQEFLRFLLDGFHEDLNRTQDIPKFNYSDEEFDALSDKEKAKVTWNRYQLWSGSYIFDIFGGQLQSKVTCLKCRHSSSTFDTFWDLSLPIPKNTGKRHHTLEDCLKEFSAEEELDDAYKCEKCKSPQKAKKCLKIYKCPEILVIHLKRFSFNFYIRRKIDDEVEFPTENLVLDNSVLSDVPGHDRNIVYDLYGISNHIGGLGGGHYVAHCKSFKDNQWYLKNDERVSETTADSGKDSTAYVLFYRRRH